MTDLMVVDANPLVSALLGGAAREVLFSARFLCYAAQHTLFEVEKYLPHLAAKLQREELALFREFELLPVISCQPRLYDHHLEQSAQLIGPRDPKDVHVLALSLSLGFPIWTDDRDFDNIPGVRVYSTAAVLQLLTQGR